MNRESARAGRDPRGLGAFSSLFTTEITEDTENEQICGQWHSVNRRKAPNSFSPMSSALPPWSRCPPWFETAILSLSLLSMPLAPRWWGFVRNKANCPRRASVPARLNVVRGRTTYKEDASRRRCKRSCRANKANFGGQAFTGPLPASSPGAIVRNKANCSRRASVPARLNIVRGRTTYKKDACRCRCKRSCRAKQSQFGEQAATGSLQAWTTRAVVQNKANLRCPPEAVSAWKKKS